MIDIFFLLLRNTKMNVSLWTCCVLMNAEPNFRRGFSRGMLAKTVPKRSSSVHTATTDISGKIEKLGIFQVN